jgi:hypothetical protein
MSSSAFQEALFQRHQILFSPNVSFRGELRKADGSDLSDDELHWLAFVLEPVTSATEEIILQRPERFTVGRPKVTPKTVITFSGMPNASARIVGEDELEVHIGVLFAFLSLKLSVNTVRQLMTGPAVDVGALERFRPPPEVIAELDRLMDAWDKSAATGWSLATLPPTPASVANQVPDDWMTPLKGMASILLGHELTHWFQTIYKPAEWARMMDETGSAIRDWMRAQKRVSRKEVEEIEALLRDDAVFANWVREAHADSGAYDYACDTSTHGGWIRGPDAAPYVMEVNINMAFFFAVLTLLEVWGMLRGVSGDFRTHPPVGVRKALFHHVQAKKADMSQEDFLFRQFGAGTVVNHVMARTIDEYVALRT